MYHHFRVAFAQYSLIVKLKLQPRRITANNVKTITKPEHFNKLQHRVEEVIATRQTLGYLEAFGFFIGKERSLRGGAFQHLLLTLSHNLSLFFRHALTSVFEFRFFAHHVCSRHSTLGVTVKFVIAYIKQVLNFAPILLTSRKCGSILIFPKPKGTPIVHHEFQLIVSIVVTVTSIENTFLLSILLGLVISTEKLIVLRNLMRPDVATVVGEVFNVHLRFHCFTKQQVYLSRKTLKRSELILTNGSCPIL